MPSRRISFMLAAALVLLRTIVPGLLWPAALWAQAPIKIGEINSYSGIGAPFTGPSGPSSRSGSGSCAIARAGAC